MEAAIAFGLAEDLDPTFGCEDWSRAKFLSPERPAAQYWDVLPVLGVDALLLEILTEKGLRRGPVLDRKRSPFYDFLKLDFVEWLIFLARGRRVGCWLFQPPGNRFRPVRPMPRAQRAAFQRCEHVMWYLFNLVGRLGDAALVLLPARGVSVGVALGTQGQPDHKRARQVVHACCGLGSPLGSSCS